jgi:5-methylcytosine-specific restriction endonuclease McrA
MATRAHTRRRLAGARKKRDGQIRASEVTITRADGTITTEAAYTPTELRRIAPDRTPVPPALRQAVLRRDKETCRYCGNTDWQLQVRHIIPPSLGGETTIRNLVTTCRRCGRAKGTNIWPPGRRPRPSKDSGSSS